MIYNVVMNQLQSIWMNFPFVKAALAGRSRKPNSDIMALIDNFKAIGFDHIRHAPFEAFKEHIIALRDQGLEWRYLDLVDHLVKLEIVGTKKKRLEGETQPTEDTIYKNYYRFWLKATQHLIASATFTLEDQKYFAYLDERQKADEQKPLTGAAKYDHVIVDEFQDINPLDLNLIKSIADRSRASITIVGDDDQAIFEWRGTTPSYILRPDHFFSRPFHTYTLAINYRSPANVVRLSQKLIAQNKRRVMKDTQPHRENNAAIIVQQTDSIDDSLDLAFGLYTDHLKDSSSATQLALIGRKQAQLIPYQIYLASKNIPFYAAEDLQIFLSKTFDRLLELLELKLSSDRRMRSYQVVDDLVKLC